jgi:hypothetical protein
MHLPSDRFPSISQENPFLASSPGPRSSLSCGVYCKRRERNTSVEALEIATWSSQGQYTGSNPVGSAIKSMTYDFCDRRGMKNG